MAASLYYKQFLCESETTMSGVIGHDLWRFHFGSTSILGLESNLGLDK